MRQWQAVVLYPSATVEVAELEPFGALYDSPYVQVIYLNELRALA